MVITMKQPYERTFNTDASTARKSASLGSCDLIKLLYTLSTVVEKLDNAMEQNDVINQRLIMDKPLFLNSVTAWLTLSS